EIVRRPCGSVVAQFPPGSLHGLAEPASPSLERKGRRRQLGYRLEHSCRLLPQHLERLRRFATAAQRAREDRRAIECLRESASDLFGLPLAGGVEAGIGVLPPAGGGTGMADQIE